MAHFDLIKAVVIFDGSVSYDGKLSSNAVYLLVNCHKRRLFYWLIVTIGGIHDGSDLYVGKLSPKAVSYVAVRIHGNIGGGK